MLIRMLVWGHRSNEMAHKVTFVSYRKRPRSFANNIDTDMAITMSNRNWSNNENAKTEQVTRMQKTMIPNSLSIAIEKPEHLCYTRMNWYYISNRLYLHHDKLLYMTLCVHFVTLVGYIVM